MIKIKKFLGIIGGLGPQSSSYLYEMIINKTYITKDQDHINMIIYNHATIPDRTSYILGKSKENPLIDLKEDVLELTNLGASLIIIPCNTAHYFYKELTKITTTPILNIIEDTIKYLKERKIKKVLILGTSGTIKTNLYQNACKCRNIEYIIPNNNEQKEIMNIIYNIKSGIVVTKEKFLNILKPYKNIEKIILGCTELSILKQKLNLTNKYIDPLEIATEKIIKIFNKKLKE